MFNLFKRKPKFPTNEELIKAIATVAALGTAEAERNYHKAVLKSTLLIARERDEARPILLVDQSGEIVLPVFTDLGRLQTVYTDAAGFGMMPAPELFQFALKNEIYKVNINPEKGPGAFLLREDLEALAQNKLPDPRHLDEPKLGDPNFVPMGSDELPPEEVLNKMVEDAQVILERDSSVDEGYVILTGEGKGKSQLTIALRFRADADEDVRSALSQQVVNAAEAIIGQPIRIIWLEGERYTAIQSVVPPFYKRDR